MSTDELFPDCGRVRGELAALLYGEVAPDARATLERHIEGCAPCRDELAALRDTQRLLARWETPVASDDTRLLARAIAAEARGAAAAPSGSAPGASAPKYRGRGRLVRWSALLSGAAAAALFTLSVLSASVRVEGGRMQIDFALPGARPADSAPLAGGWHDDGWDNAVREIAAQEVAARSVGLEQAQEDLLERYSTLQLQEMQQELLRVTKAVDYAIAENNRAFEQSMTTLCRDVALADREQRIALTNLASYIPEPNR